jgi:hypothetical protein
MSWVKKITSKSDSTAIELLSLHIPKTAGTSFHRTLQSVYGDKHVVRFEWIKGQPFMNSEPYAGQGLPAQSKVIHGHYTTKAIRELFPLEEVPVITWVRNPVDRVISNYYYLAKRLEEIVDEESNHWHILEKMQKSLLEFAHAEVNRNRISKFLAGADLEDFFFVGVVENYNEELEYLAQKLNWSNYQSERDNVSGSKSRFVSEAVRDEIQALNQKDMEVYRRALILSEKRSKL